MLRRRRNSVNCRRRSIDNLLASAPDHALKQLPARLDVCVIHLLGVLRFRVVIRDRKSTRLNSSHGYISYAVFCLKKKKRTMGDTMTSSIWVTSVTSTADT